MIHPVAWRFCDKWPLENKVISLDVYDLAPVTAVKIRVGDSRLRAELESRILANQPQSDIAARMNLTFEAVEAYESRFFNVRPILTDPTRVWDEIIGGRPSDILDIQDVARFWFTVSYCLGTYFFDQFVNFVDRDKLRHEGLLAYLERRCKLSLESKLQVAKACVPILRSEEGMYWARHFARSQSSWDGMLPEDGLQAAVYARVLSLFLIEFLREERAEHRKIWSDS